VYRLTHAKLIHVKSKLFVKVNRMVFSHAFQPWNVSNEKEVQLHGKGE
jgi:hypothetical protein